MVQIPIQSLNKSLALASVLRLSENKPASDDLGGGIMRFL